MKWNVSVVPWSFWDVSQCLSYTEESCQDNGALLEFTCPWMSKFVCLFVYVVYFEILTCPLSSKRLLVSLRRSKETVCFIHWDPLAGESGWKCTLPGGEVSPRPATTQEELWKAYLHRRQKNVRIRYTVHMFTVYNKNNLQRCCPSEQLFFFLFVFFYQILYLMWYVICVHYIKNIISFLWAWANKPVSLVIYRDEIHEQNIFWLRVHAWNADLECGKHSPEEH